MSSRHLEHLYAPFAACVVVLLMYGCQDHGKVHDNSTKSTQTAMAIEAHGEVLQGACSKSDRDKFVHHPSAKFVSQLTDCSKDTWAKNTKNMACLADTLPSLSKGCAGCFADTASCAMDNCKMACLFSSTSESCRNCAKTNCQTALAKCSGVARADLP